MKQKTIKGYKVFQPDFTAKEGNIKYAENKEFKHEGEIKICSSGFHFCLKVSHCFNYYSFDSKNIVCEVEALGNVEYHDEDSKAVTDHIRIGKRLTWAEVLIVANEGKDNTGHSNTGYSNTGNSNTGNSNTGDKNTGNSNTGDRNTGDRNTGYRNTGNSNTGNWNTGDKNTGYSNTGNSNTGNSNTGDRNTGDRNTGNSNTGNSNTGYSNTGNSNTGDKNTGNSNTGDRNTGDRNTGYSNTGNSNTGDKNTGNSNTGYSNTGDRNTGDKNTGNSNTGYSNTGDRNTGVFCTGEKTLKFFNKDSDWTEEKFRNSKVFSLLCQVDTKLWIPESKMTDKEKEQHIGWKNAEGFYRNIPFKKAFSDKWNNWSEANRNEFKNLPNFDKKVFTLITSVKI